MTDPKEVLRETIAGARRKLRDGRLTDEAVHQARKELKRARASLRLLRDAVGKPAYARENARLRDAARPLARVRDAKVTLEAVERLLRREKKPLRRAALLKLRRVLREERSGLRRELSDPGKLSAIEQPLDEAARSVRRWGIPLDRKPVLRSGIERIYRKGRKALEEIGTGASNARLHESRKQVKYLWQALRIVQPDKAPRRVAKQIELAEAVADTLGDDHDLAVLQARIARLFPRGDEAVRELRSRIQRRRDRLQKKALKQARRLFKKKPKVFIGRMPVS